MFVSCNRSVGERVYSLIDSNKIERFRINKIEVVVDSEGTAVVLIAEDGMRYPSDQCYTSADAAFYAADEAQREMDLALKAATPIEAIVPIGESQP